MEQTQVYGFYGEGRNLCPNCAMRIYGTSLEKYVRSGGLQLWLESGRKPCYTRGLLCDDCYHWIFKPEIVDMPWWREEPAAEEHLRLLAPFTHCLERLGVDISNLREADAVR